MRLTTDATRFNPMMHWPAEPGAFYTIIISNLDINSRRNRYIAYHVNLHTEPATCTMFEFFALVIGGITYSDFFEKTCEIK